MIRTFNYNTFLQYYSNNRNLQIDPSPPIFNYYHHGIKQSIKSGKYIISNNKKIYVDVDLNIKEAFFTIYDANDPYILDNHYHFGIKQNFKDKTSGKNIDVVYFHKTTQIVDTSGKLINKKHNNCYFYLIQDINDVKNIQCLESRLKMGQQFPIGLGDIEIIEDILQRPFKLIQRPVKSLKKPLHKPFKPYTIKKVTGGNSIKKTNKKYTKKMRRGYAS